MKKTVFTALLCLAASAVSAETLTPYTEQFDNPTQRPKGWTQLSSSSYAPATYTVHSEGGHSGGYVTAKQYSSTWSSYYNNYNYIDVLVTPKVYGELTLWVRANGSEPTLTFYSVTDNTKLPSTRDLKFLEGTDRNLLAGKDVTAWTQITVAGVPDGSYVGIRAHDLDIDDFGAAKADVTYRASLVADVSNTTGGTRLEADQSNKVTVKFKVSLENDGDIDFPASDEGFKIELYNANLDNKVFGTDKITEAIPYGAKVEKEFSMTGTAEVAPNTVSNNYKVRISHEKCSPIETSLAWFTVIPYAPVANLMLAEDNDKNASSSNSVNVTEVVPVGIGAAGTARTLWLWNSGTAPLEISAVKVTGDLACHATPFTLDAGAKKAVTVSLAGVPGRKDGTVTFTDATLGDIVYRFAGVVKAEGDYCEDFEAEGSPEGMITGNTWKTTGSPVSLAPIGGTTWINQTSTSSQAKLITPLLSFNEGEKLHFFAAKTDNMSSTLKVYTSPDRVNWTEVLAIGARDTEPEETRFGSDKPTGSGYGTYEFKLFSAPMPAGKCYVAFEAGGARLDNICGGRREAVAHDLYVTALSVPEKGSVNTRFITSITLQNLLAATETGYSVILESDGLTLASAAEAPALDRGASATYDLRFTPHAEGPLSGKFIYINGSDRMELASFTADIEAEKAEAEYQVGDAKITTSDPLNTYYQGAQAQILYTAEMLGMSAGHKVTGFTFIGYNEQPVKKHVKVWIENTDAEGYDLSNVVAADRAGMTAVFDADYDFAVCGDKNAKKYEPVFEINFDKPFVYTGGSLRIMVDSRDVEGGTGSRHVFFAVDNSAYDYWNDKYENKVIENRKEYAEDLDDEPSWVAYKAGYPVTFFKVAKDIVMASGTVTDDFGSAVAGASVNFETTFDSDFIFYNGVTDENGAYTVKIFKPELTYLIAATAEGLATWQKPDVTFDPATDPTPVFDITMNWLDRSATLSGRVTNITDGGAPLEGSWVRLDNGSTAIVTNTDANGEYTLTVNDFGRDYTFNAGMGPVELYNTPYTFASRADVKDIEVGWSGLSATSTDAAPTVTVAGRTITVAAPAGTPVTLCDARGIQLDSRVSDGTPMSFTAPAPGLYIVAGVKAAVR